MISVKGRHWRIYKSFGFGLLSWLVEERVDDGSVIIIITTR